MNLPFLFFSHPISVSSLSNSAFILYTFFSSGPSFFGLPLFPVLLISSTLVLLILWYFHFAALLLSKDMPSSRQLISLFAKCHNSFCIFSISFAIFLSKVFI